MKQLSILPLGLSELMRERAPEVVPASSSESVHLEKYELH